MDAVIGGGMAGAVVALHLQAAGRDVRIVERRRKAGTTLCGEGISDRTLRCLRPVFDASPYIDQTFQGARWRFPGTTVLVHRRCHTMARESWIPAMLDVFEARGGTIEWGHARVSVPEAAHVIGADGPGSKVRQAMGARVEMRLGMQARVATDHETDHLEFLTDKRLGAEYAWWFPRGDAHNIGLLGDAGDEKRLPDVLEAFGVEGTLGKVEAFPIAFGGKQFVSRDGRTLLIGDAAGLTNPVTKGGIAAIVHAAPMLARAVAGGRPHSYQKTLDRHPLTHPSYLRALRRLRRWSQADLRRLLSVAPDPIHVLGTQRTPVAPIAARALMRRPWSARAMLDFYQATARSIDWSW